MKIPKDKILRRPKCEERDERSERLIRTAPWIGHEDVEPEEYKQEKREEVEKDEHDLEDRPFSSLRAKNRGSLSELNFQVHADRKYVPRQAKRIVYICTSVVA